MQVVHEYVGYTTKGWAVAIWKLLAILTGGLTWVIARYSPRSYLWTLRRCPLSKATHVHVKVKPPAPSPFARLPQGSVQECTH